MLKAVEATIETNGQIHLLEPIHLTHPCRAIVTIIEEPEILETALLSHIAISGYSMPRQLFGRPDHTIRLHPIARRFIGLVG